MGTRGVCLACAYGLVLLCPLALSQLNVDFNIDNENDDEFQVQESEKFQSLGLPAEWHPATMPPYRSSQRRKRQIISMEKDAGDYYSADDVDEDDDVKDDLEDYKDDDDGSEDNLNTSKRQKQIKVLTPHKLVVTVTQGKVKLNRYGVQSPIIIVTERPPSNVTALTAAATTTLVSTIATRTTTTRRQPQTTTPRQPKPGVKRMRHRLQKTSSTKKILEHTTMIKPLTGKKPVSSLTTTILLSSKTKPVTLTSSTRSLSRKPKTKAPFSTSSLPPLTRKSSANSILTAKIVPQPLFTPTTETTSTRRHKTKSTLTKKNESLSLKKPTPISTLSTKRVRSKKKRPKTVPTTTTKPSSPPTTAAPIKQTKKKNLPPKVKRPLDRLVITAGKAFRYILPLDTFMDPEDGLSLNLRIYEADNTALDKDSWLQFLPHEREIYGLPLESHVSVWNFIIEARDTTGLATRAPLNVTVQQHTSTRTINHKFILAFKLNQPYVNVVDWQIRALEGIVTLLGDTDMQKFTVLDAKQTEDICEFVWTNETISKLPCHVDGVVSLMEKLSDGYGSPSRGLVAAFRPELIVVGVRWEGPQRCIGGPAPAIPHTQLDLLTATAGHLLVYRIPEDTFFDPEDGYTRNLQLSLRLSDGTQLPHGHWLQLDPDRQELYGLPGPNDVGTVNYQLVAEDSAKKSSFDNLLVEVVKAPPIRPTAEFRVILDYPYPELAYNAMKKRKLIEKLAALFGQNDTVNIRVASINDSPTTVIWYNTSLSMDVCPIQELLALREIFSTDEYENSETNLKSIVDQVFGPDFKVLTMTIDPVGLCFEENSKPDDLMPPVFAEMVEPELGKNEELMLKHDTIYDDLTNQDHMITLVLPAIVMWTMIVLVVLITSLITKRRTPRPEDVPRFRFF